MALANITQMNGNDTPPTVLSGKLRRRKKIQQLSKTEQEILILALPFLAQERVNQSFDELSAVFIKAFNHLSQELRRGA